VPRIRSIKPEHRQHRKVGPLSDREFRLWISMISEADDAGRLVCDASQLRVQTWGYHPKVTTAQVEAALQQIAKVGLVAIYTVNKIRYAVFPSWKDHQHPKYPTPSKLPPPTEDFLQASPKPPPALPETLPTRVVESRLVGLKGVETQNRGEGSRGEESNGNDAFKSTPPRGAYHSILASIRTHHPELSEAEARNQALDQFQRNVRR
jgi:hypothetical protein